MRIPENNSLKKEIEELLDLCEKKEKEDELGRTYFNEPVSEEKMTRWEEENGVKIPESYKEWLRFTEKCMIDGTTANFWGPDEFNSNYVPEDLVVIGEMIGDGEMVCFSKESGEFVSFFEYRINEMYKDFNDIMIQIMGLLGKKVTYEDGHEVTQNELAEIMKKWGII